MHIIITLITAIAGLLWALNRLQNSGVNLNAFNPFFWMRRRQWEQKLNIKPIHSLHNTIDAASVLMVAMAKMDGDITREQKSEILTMFETEFKLLANEAVESYGASSYMLQDTVNIVGEVKNILAPTLDKFESHHKRALMEMLNKISTMEGEPTKEQRELIVEVELQFECTKSENPKW